MTTVFLSRFGHNPPFPAGEQISHSFVATIEAAVCSDRPSDPFMVDPRVTLTARRGCSAG